MENQNPDQAPLQPQPQVSPLTPDPDPAQTTAEPVTPPADLPTKPKFKLKINKVVLLVLFALIVLAAAGGVYHWQHSQVTQALANYKTVSDGNTTLRLQLTHLLAANQTAAPSPTVAAAPTTDELVLAAVKNYCNANVDPTTKKALVLKVGKAGTSQKQVLYSADKNFAYVNAICSKDGAAGGSSAAYYLKKANDSWVFLYRGQAASPEYTTLYNIPADFK